MNLVKNNFALKLKRIARYAVVLIAISNLTPITTAEDANAQTCRVALGRNAEGHKCYMEVYEYDFVSHKPCFPGGDTKLVEFINNNRRYPDAAYKAGIQGKVTCSFVVHANGSVSHIKVVKSVETSLNQEAMRILSLMPEWEPGRIGERPVPVRVIWSVPFRI